VIEFPSGRLILMLASVLFLFLFSLFFVIHCMSVMIATRLTIFPNQCAGLGRFLNGAKSVRDANVRVQRVLDSDGRMHVLMITTCAVRKGTELKWPYGKHFPIHALSE